tara:strand:+ start:527 stop:2062 length:1536 start_codon:yes stop_codon:yes gene_type:complete
MQNLNNNSKYDVDINSNKDTFEINLNDLIETIFRRKKYFLSALIIFLGLGYWKTFEDPTWQGEFQIVISSTKDKTSGLSELGTDIPILSLLNNTQLSNNLKTEVKILESSSVLNPIFNFVKEEKKIKNKNSNIKFNNWKESLDIDLFEGTSVLNLKYRDKNKELIIPVLEKLSNTYQKYSNRDRQRSLNQGIDYLNEQKILLNKNAQDSLDELMKFSIANNYFVNNDIAIKNQSINKQENLLPFNFNDSKNSPYASKLLLLSQLEALLLEKSAVFEDESQVIKQLKQRIKNLQDSISKPTDKLITLKNLRKRAMRDEIMVTNVENQLAFLNLEKAKKENPWELVSAPTLLEDPIAPRKLLILAISFLLGTFSGIISAIIVDKKSKIIFNLNEVNKSITYPFISKINIKDKKSFSKILRIILKNHPSNKEVVLLPFADKEINKDLIQELSFLVSNLSDKKVLISQQLEKNKEIPHILLIIKSKSSYKTLEEYLQDIELLSIPILGWIFLESK